VSAATGGTRLLVIRLEAQAVQSAAFDTWLRDHVADVLQEPGVLAAKILDDDTDTAPHCVRRAVHYQLLDATVMPALAAAQPGWPEAGAQPVFAGSSVLTRELLCPREEFQSGAPTTENCANCGEVLTGQHCAHCGQHARVRVLSLWGLLRDVTGDLLNWDARLWRTLRPLALRPGFLTREYLVGRRLAYTPPFRMYLILSLLVFVLAPLDGDVVLGVSSGDPLVQAGAHVLGETGPSADDVKETCDKDLRVNVGPFAEAWEPRLRQACHRVLSDPGGFGVAMLDNIPRMMFVFLPLVALIMQLLYVGSGRFYVEHLLFFVHFHGAFFLGALCVMLFGLGERIPGPVGVSLGWLGGAGTAALVIYLPYYLYRSMRRVYGQGRGWTLLKLSLLVGGYVICLGLTVMALLVFTALER
jgi:hypothetical protein